jgi:carbohydrate kinase (thermoresistant glucokinase family)
MIIIVMGVAGAGKTTIGQALAQRLMGEFLEGDAYHPQANIDKMSRGVPLTDEDRAGWLTRLVGEIERRNADRTATITVISCSALKKQHRDRLRAADPALRLVYLRGSRQLLEQRLAARRDHFLPPALLTSQLSTLEPPADDESPIVADIAAPVHVIVEDLANELS